MICCIDALPFIHEYILSVINRDCELLLFTLIRITVLLGSIYLSHLKLLPLLLLRHLLTLSLRKTKRALKLSFYEQVLQNQANSQLCGIGEWNSKYINKIKRAFSIGQADWILTYFYMTKKDLGGGEPSISLEAIFSTEIHVTNSLQSCYFTETHTLTQAHEKSHGISSRLHHIFKCCFQPGTFTTEHTSDYRKK